MSDLEPVDDPLDDYDENKKAFFKELEKMRPDLMYPESWSDVDKAKAAEMLRPTRVKTGMLSSIPMRCRGHSCVVAESCPLLTEGINPEGNPCHPPGELILTLQEGYVPIEHLDADFHTLVSWEKHHDCFRRGSTNSQKGYRFKVGKKHFHGDILTLSAGSFSHKVTYDHVSVAKFNDNAIDKFCVYLMRKDHLWRIGKSKLVNFSQDRSRKRGIKYHLPFAIRGNTEDADAMWILGVYDNNTEALLAEEYLSLKFQVSKVSFADSLDKKESKYNGLYKWATRDQILSHHMALAQEEDFYSELLSNFGLSIDYPIWKRGGFGEDEPEMRPRPRLPMFIRACNIIPGVMDVPLFEDENNIMVAYKNGNTYEKPRWKSVKIDREQYHGDVFALDVEGHKTYVADGIVTRNCPIEQSFVLQLFSDYVEELNVDVSRMVEVSLVRDLVDQEVQHLRKTWILSQEHFIQENVAGLDADGNVITAKELHKAVEYEDKILKRKEKIRSALLATREAKAKAGQAQADGAQVIANILEEMREIDKARDKALKAKLGIAEHDEYIDAEIVDEEDDNEEA